ncbi:MAG: Ig-like domain-containing protein [Fibrobacterales bacterium]
MKLITGVVVLLFVLTGCFNAGVNDTNQEMAESDDSSVVRVNLDILLGQHRFDSIRYEVVPGESDSFDGSLEVDSDDAQTTVVLDIPRGEKSTITYYCYIGDDIAAGNNEVIQAIVETTITSSPDYVPVVINNVSEYRITVDETFQFDIDVDDISPSLTYEYDFVGDGVFTTANRHIYRAKGTYSAVIRVGDGINVVVVPLEVIVLERTGNPDFKPIEKESDVYTIDYVSTQGGSVSGSATSIAGGEVTVKFVESPGYQFDTFVLDSGKANLEGNLLTEIKSDVMVTAQFTSKKYDIIFEIEGDCGSVTTEDALQYAINVDDITIGTTLDNNCNVYFSSEHLNVLDSTINGISPEGLAIVNDSLVVTVTFTEKVLEQVRVSVECYLDGERQSSCDEVFGSVEPSLFTLSEDNTQKLLMPISQNGYQFIEFTAESTIQMKGDTVIFKEGPTDGLVNAYFKTTEFEVSLTSGAHGTISPSTITTSIDIEETVTVNASADLGYVFDGWEVFNCTIADGFDERSDEVRFSCIDTGVIQARFIGLPPNSISINNGPGKMVLGAANITLDVTILPNSTPNKQVLWSSSNSDIVRVANGVLEAVSGGNVDITATTADGNRTQSISVAVDSLLDTRIDTSGVQKKYKIVRINDVVWMAENLDYRKKGGCAGMGESRCDEYGSYYRYDSLATACPAGWIVPSKSDWESLEQYIDADNGGVNDNAGYSLKAFKTGWTDPYAGNRYGFSALPSGFGKYTGAPSSGGAYWWSSTYHSEHAIFKIPNYWTASITSDALTVGYNVSGDSVPLRCIQD